ncbi:MAG: SAM-dependent methyltransferase [Deltaproteobacteria bacterium]|nr:SAM-dependent methyltransferase [Deltaproteobacteria bacterium]
MVEIKTIGVVKNEFNDLADPFEMKKCISKIEIDKIYADGLYRLDECDEIQIIFDFHKSTSYKLRHVNYFGEDKGVFAACSPHRPGSIGVTTVKLLKIEDCILTVTGLDAINETPVVDIKPAFFSSTPLERKAADVAEMKKFPRKKLLPLIKNNDTETLLLEAGILHGHYCPGLSMGVVAGAAGMRYWQETSDGLEDIVAIVEVNSCMVDGIQFVTGCSIGNNGLIYKDFGKTAVTIAKRSTKEGIRFLLKPDFHQSLKKDNPAFTELFTQVIVNQNRDPQLVKKFKAASTEASFHLLKWPLDKLFDQKLVTADIPDYAPIRDSHICENCMESYMDIKAGNENRCLPCSGKAHHQLDGRGISLIKQIV